MVLHVFKSALPVAKSLSNSNKKCEHLIVSGNRESTKLISKQLSDLWKVPIPEGNRIPGPFTSKELANALKHQEQGKSPGLDSIFPEFILHAGSNLESWFCDFLTSCMRQLKIPRIWRRALIVAFPKPEKLGTQRAIVHISTVCLLQYAREAHLRSCRTYHRPVAPSETTVEQVTVLTQGIEKSFSANKKARAVFVDLTAAYDIVWHRGLAYKLLRCYLTGTYSSRHVYGLGSQSQLYPYHR